HRCGRIAPGVAAGVQGNVCKLLAGRSELIEVTLSVQREPRYGRHGTERRQPFVDAAGTLLYAVENDVAVALAGRCLRNGTEYQDMAGETGIDRANGIEDGAKLAWCFAPAGEPVELQVKADAN